MEDGIVEPVARVLAMRLRRAVLEHATTERRRVFPAVLHVGCPEVGAAEHTIDRADPTDHALRTDVVSAMLERMRPASDTPLVWLSRPGPADEVRDVDLEWLAATTAAAAELGRHLPYVVLDRRAWRDPRTGVSRTWRRLRQR